MADEHISRHLIRGLRLREPKLDIIRVHDVGLRTEDDDTLLALAAQENRILVTFDTSTVPRAAYNRVVAGLDMPGVAVIRSDLSIAHIIDDLLLLALASTPEDCQDQVIYLPL